MRKAYQGDPRTHVVNDSPHPQDPFELGLLKVNSDLRSSKLGVSQVHKQQVSKPSSHAQHTDTDA